MNIDHIGKFVSPAAAGAANESVLSNPDLMLKIFGLVGRSALSNCILVCRHWKLIGVHNNLWRPILERIFPAATFPVEEGASYREKLIEFRASMDRLVSLDKSAVEQLDGFFDPPRQNIFRIRNGKIYSTKSSSLHVWDIESKTCLKSLPISVSCDFDCFKDEIVSAGHPSSRYLRFFDAGSGRQVRTVSIEDIVGCQTNYIESLVVKKDSIYALCSATHDDYSFRLAWNQDTQKFNAKAWPLRGRAKRIKLVDDKIYFQLKHRGSESSRVAQLDEERDVVNPYFSQLEGHSFDVFESRGFSRLGAYWTQYLDGRLYYATSYGLVVEDPKSGKVIKEWVIWPSRVTTFEIFKGIIIASTNDGSLCFIDPNSSPHKKARVSYPNSL